MNKAQHLKLSSAVCALMAAMASPALARSESTDKAAPAVDRPDQIQEIVVTARRREERSQLTPVSLTAINQQSLVAANIQRSSDLTRVAPNLVASWAISTPTTSWAAR